MLGAQTPPEKDLSPPTASEAQEALPGSHREKEASCAAMALFCQTGLEVCSSPLLSGHVLTALPGWAPQLWWDSCTEGPQRTQPLSCRVAAPDPLLQLRRLKRGPRASSPPQGCFAEASPQLGARDPSACRDYWPHTVTGNAASVPRGC